MLPNEAVILERARRFAREHAIYLLMGMGTFDPGAARPVHNHAVLVDPEGAIAYSYTKITAVPGFEAQTNIRGRGPIPVADTPYGRIVSPICYDLDFPFHTYGANFHSCAACARTNSLRTIVPDLSLNNGRGIRYGAVSFDFVPPSGDADPDVPESIAKQISQEIRRQLEDAVPAPTQE